jgi:hypothetical protein
MADSKIMPHATVGYVTNSNVLALSDSSPVRIGMNGSDRKDSLLTYAAGLDTDFLFGNQRFYANGLVTRSSYSKLSELDHDEHTLEGGLQWQLTRTADGKLSYRQERRMLSFADIDQTTKLNTTGLILENEKDYTGTFNLRITPNWRAETSAERRVIDSPRPPTVNNPAGSPNLGLREVIYIEGLKYLGIAKLSAGVEAQQINGHFDDATGGVAVDYKLSTARAAATYKSSDRSTFNLQAGTTKRSQARTEAVSAFTYLLGYDRALTDKTTINLQFARAVDSFLTSANAELSTTKRLGLTWRPTVKTSFAISQEWRDAEYEGFPSDFGSSINRQDKYRISSFDVRYQALRWIALHPYWRNEARHSNTASFTFDANVVGVELVARAP